MFTCLFVFCACLFWLLPVGSGLTAHVRSASQCKRVAIWTFVCCWKFPSSTIHFLSISPFGQMFETKPQMTTVVCIWFWLPNENKTSVVVQHERERDREWARERGRERERERDSGETERQSEKERETDRQTDRQRKRWGDRESVREREWWRDRDRESESDGKTETAREWQGRENAGEIERERDSGEKEIQGDRQTDRQTDRERERRPYLVSKGWDGMFPFCLWLGLATFSFTIRFIFYFSNSGCSFLLWSRFWFSLWRSKRLRTLNAFDNLTHLSPVGDAPWNPRGRDNILTEDTSNSSPISEP